MHYIGQNDIKKTMKQEIQELSGMNDLKMVRQGTLTFHEGIKL